MDPFNPADAFLRQGKTDENARLIAEFQNMAAEFEALKREIRERRPYAAGLVNLTWSGGNHSASVTVKHGLGRTPIIVLGGAAQGSGISVTADTWNGTTFSIRGAYSLSTLTGTYTVSWVALG